MNETAYQYLSIEKQGHLNLVSFNRPEHLNALNMALMEEIYHCARTLSKDDQCRVVVFTGKGQHFSSGLDLSDGDFLDRFSSASRLMKVRHLKLGPEMIRAIHEIDQITIAAINGAAMGGGACIASACDFRIGASDCSVGYPEVNLAMNLSWVSLPLLVHLIGPVKAKQMVILAERVDAETLHRWGFLDQIVPGEILKESAVKLAKRYAEQAPLAAQMVKRSINAISSALDRAIMHMDTDQFLYAISGTDFDEGLSAFLENRKPQFKGD